MTTTELALYDDSPTGQALALVGPAGELVDKISNTSFVPAAYRGKPGELLAAILTGAELGLGPMTAIGKVHNIEGRASLSSEVMRALVLSRGHHIVIAESGPAKVTVVGWRANDERPVDGENRFTWTMDMAKRAGLDSRQNWRKYPQAMLLARATAELCRAVFPDCMAGITYSDEELADGIVDDVYGEPLAADPDAPAEKPKATTRKLPAKRAAAPVAPVPAAPVPDADEDPMGDLEAIDALADEPKVPAKKAAPRKAQGPPPPIAPDRPEEDGARLKPEQVLAMRCGEAGIGDDTSRHMFYFAATGGKHRSGKTMKAGEVSGLLEFLDGAIAGGEPLRVDVEADGAISVMLADEEAFFAVDESLVVAPPAEGGEPPGEVEGDPSAGWSDTEWQQRFRAKGGLAQVLRWAAGKASELGLESPPTLKDQLVGSEGAFRVALVSWLGEGEAS